MLIGAGIYFTVRTRFVQFRRFGHLFSVMARASCHCEGVAIDLTLGGPGAVFWMWCVALIGMATAFEEATLAQLYKVPQPDGTFRGGPAYYIQRGLGSRG